MDNIEKLMRPRFEVILDYPNSEFKVGEILEFYLKQYDIGQEWLCNHVYWSTSKNLIEKYPKVFRPLNWYEHRSIEEMPEYFLSKEGCHYFDIPDKGLALTIQPNEVIKVDRYTDSGKFIYKGRTLDVCSFEPATAQEYESYLKSQSKK